MSSLIRPEDINQIVEEVYRRVRTALENPAPPSPPSPSSPSSPSSLPAPSVSSSASAPGEKRSACSLAHGVASQPPSVKDDYSGYSAPSAPSSGSSGSGGVSGSGGASVLVKAGACRLGHSTSDDHSSEPAPACSELSGYIDHTLLKPTATDVQVHKLCEEARKYKFATVCVHSAHVGLCADLLRGSGVKVCTVVGFPLGSMTSESKAFETRDAIARGAEEVDMVIHVGKLQQGDYGYVIRDIEAVVKAAHGVPVKVILETSLLNDEQKIIACALSKAAGAQFVKTSTGFGPGGATVEDIALMRRVVGPEMGVKASGGIRDCQTAQQMVSAGATRIGASASVAIVRESAKSA